jgi:hypothetical protein
MRFAVPLLLILRLALPLSGAGSFLFIQAADPQLGMFAQDRDFLQETSNWQFVIENVNPLHPAFLVIRAELTNRAGVQGQIAEYKRINAQPVHLGHIGSVAGNRNARNEPAPASLAEELARANAGGRTIVVFQHHPLFLEEADEPEQYCVLALETGIRIPALFHQWGIHYMFAGHYQRNSYARNADLEMITTGPAGMPIGPDPSGVRIDSECVSYTALRLGEIADYCVEWYNFETTGTGSRFCGRVSQ